MSRGRRTPSIAAPAGTGPDFGSILRGELSTIASGMADGSIPITTRPHGGGLGGDLDLHAGDLVELALLAAVSGLRGQDLAKELLERAKAHQIEHLERLKAAREHPRTAGAAIWRHYNLPYGRDSQAASYKILRRERERLEEIERLLKQPPMSTEGVRRGVLMNQAIRHVSRPLLTRLLATEPGRALELGVAVAEELRDERMMNALTALTPADLTAAGRLAEAARILGEDTHPLQIMAERPADKLRQRELERASGDRGEADLADYWQVPPDRTAPVLFPLPRDHFGYEDHHVLEPAADADTALARARGLLRRPELHAPVPLRGTGRVVHVPVTRAVLQEMAREPGQDIELLRGPGNEGTIRLALIRRARVAAGSSEHPIEVRFCLELGASSKRSLGPLLAEVLEPAGLSLPDGMAPQKVRAWPPATRAGSASPAHAVRLGHSCAGPRRTMDELLGPDECDHRAGGWRLSAGKDTAILGCPSCLRRRVAVVPLHRLPREHPLWAQAGHGEETYLRMERAARVLAGAPDPGERARISDLLAAEGAADLDPAAYTQAPVRKVARVRRSLADTLARR